MSNIDESNESKLIDEYMADTQDDDSVIKFLNSSECTIEMVNYEDSDDWTALNLASRLGRYEVVKELVEKGADVNQINGGYSYNALMFCIWEVDCYSEQDRLEKSKLVDLLIGAGTNLDYKDRFSAFTMACNTNETEIIKKILEYDIDIDFKDEDGMSGEDYLKENKNEAGLQAIELFRLNKKLNKNLKINNLVEKKKKM